MKSLLTKILEEAAPSLFQQLTVAFVGSAIASAGQEVGSHLVRKVVENREERERDRVRSVISELAMHLDHSEPAQPQPVQPPAPPEEAEEEAPQEEDG